MQSFLLLLGDGRAGRMPTAIGPPGGEWASPRQPFAKCTDLKAH